MGTAFSPIPVKLIVGLISSDCSVLDQVRSILLRGFGSADQTSELFDFPWTDYYQKEMGSNLKRQFIGFKRLIPAEKLAGIKIWTNRLEKKFSKNSLRWINIDPGYLALSKLVLATTKNFAHRIYIKKGIFEEVTLSFKKTGFISCEWTYPDFRSLGYLEFFNKMRAGYYEQVKELYGLSQLYRCL